MGRAKEEMMRLQEMEPMIEWIEENYGLTIEDEDSDEWNEAAMAYDIYLERQHLSEDYFDEIDLDWYTQDESQAWRFESQLENVNEILKSDFSGETRFTLLVMLHGHIVASLESYLASTFIQKINESEELTRKLVESDPTFAKMKFSLKEIYEKSESLKITVIGYLKDLIFHDIAKVKPMFLKVLGCDFGNIEWLFKAVSIRHHCVHRAGLDKDGKKVELSDHSIDELMTNAKSLVEKIEKDVKELEVLDVDF